MIKNVIGTVKGALMFYEGNGVEVINENTCGRYLKDRKGRTLSFDDIEHYRKIISVLKETKEIIDKIG